MKNWGGCGKVITESNFDLIYFVYLSIFYLWKTTGIKRIAGLIWMNFGMST